MTAREARQAPVTSNGWRAVSQRDPNTESAKKRAQAAARVSWATYKGWKAAMATELLDAEGLLSVSIDMGEDLHEGGSSSLLPLLPLLPLHPPLPPPLLKLLPLLLPLQLPLLPLLLAAGGARPGRRRIKPKPPCARSRSRFRVQNPTTTRDMAIWSRSAPKRLSAVQGRQLADIKNSYQPRRFRCFCGYCF
jgi:hypothetical protein